MCVTLWFLRELNYTFLLFRGIDERSPLWAHVYTRTFIVVNRIWERSGELLMFVCSQNLFLTGLALLYGTP